MIRRIILPLLLLVSIVLSIFSYRKLDGAMMRATMHLQKGISYAQAKEYLWQESERDESVRALFFRETTNAEINATILEICGDARLLINGMEMLAEEDVFGCLISEALAQELFRSSKVQGSQITLDEKVYTVRGVYAESEKQFIRLNRDENIHFEQVRVQKQENKTAEATLQEFAERYALSGKVLRWTEYVGLVKGILLVATGVLAMFFWKWGRRAFGSIPALKVVRILYIGIVFTLLWRQIHIPDNMIPAKWSDFAYWGVWFQNTRTSIGNVFLLEKIGYEKIFLLQGLYSIIGSLGVGVIAVMNMLVLDKTTLRRRKNKEE